MADQTPELDARTFDDSFAAKLRGFGPVGSLVFLVILAGNGLLGPFRALPVIGAWIEQRNGTRP